MVYSFKSFCKSFERFAKDNHSANIGTISHSITKHYDRDYFKQYLRFRKRQKYPI